MLVTSWYFTNHACKILKGVGKFSIKWNVCKFVMVLVNYYDTCAISKELVTR